MKIGVYVGSFNPVHKGHIQVINYLLNNLIIDKVIVIATENYWEKNNLIDVEHRINMLKTYETDNIIININLNDLQYTHQVLDELKKDYSDLYLIIGDDNLVNFDKWKNVDDILNNKVIVMDRISLDLNQYTKKFNNKENFISIKDPDSIKVSSTYIRDLMSKKNFIEIEKYLDKQVIDYILKNKLYE